MTPVTRLMVLQDLVLAIVINTSAMLLSGAAITLTSWYPGACTAFCTNVLLQLILPVPAAGRLCSAWLGTSKVRPWVSVFVENLIFVTCISFTMAVMQTGPNGIIDTWLATYGQLVVIGYLTSMVLYYITTSIVTKPVSAK
ncbi:ABC transporter ATPase [Bifidobacterium simiarum]|uniref:ABC transporter ATPase n=1 Tax=Bifidobacterium simiarum TaxID=2045441 RepID=A0A2M9HG40_9BIFI|nr:ABC transporter ATPase [Bifidobacterium simiarum]PJM75784.1 ABC transporter ATPase [Bifidobacterium simiarum]